MNRLIAVLLLTALPLQYAWAALGAYCLHEEGAASQQHFGHHVHKHQEAGGQTESGSSASHNDCALCHLGCAGMSAVEPMRWHSEPTEVAVLDSRFALTDVSSEPERPKWAAAA